MRLLIASAAAVMLLAAPSFAQDGGPIGESAGSYVGSGEGNLSAEITHIQDDIYAVSIQTIVPMENNIPGCGGGIAGETILSETGGNFFVENEEYDPKAEPNPITGERYCEIAITFDENGILILEEKDGCMYYHGASCGFSGQLIKEGAAG